MSRIRKLLKEKKGASILLVLACMLFLVTIGAMTMTSALSAVSVTQTAKDKLALDFQAESLQVTIHELLNDTTEVAGAVNLQTAIVGAAYNHDADPSTYHMLDSMVISVEDEELEGDGVTTQTVVYSYNCKINSNLSVSGGEVSGIIEIEAIVDIDEADPSLTGIATYLYGFSLDGAEYDATTNRITSYGNWTLVKYEKIEQ